jgi:hypothetical protein
MVVQELSGQSIELHGTLDQADAGRVLELFRKANRVQELMDLLGLLPAVIDGKLIDKPVGGELLDQVMATLGGDGVEFLTGQSANLQAALAHALLQRAEEARVFVVSFRALIPGFEGERIQIAVVKENKSAGTVRDGCRKIGLTHPVRAGIGQQCDQQGSEHETRFGTPQGVPAGGREAPGVKTYSLTQRWSPALAGREGRVFRPHLVALVDESEGTCPAVEMVENALRPAALARWLADKIGKTQPGNLLVDDANLVGPMSMYFPKLSVSWCDNPPGMTRFLAGLLEQLPPDRELEFSLVDHFGPSRALPFYGAARDFYAAKPWERVPNSELLTFTNARGHWNVVVLGSEGQEFGFYVVDENGLPPTCGVLLHEPAYLAAPDLDLIDRAGLVYPSGEYPWILTQYLPDPLDEHWLTELSWLLDALAQLQAGALESDGRRLARALDPTEVLVNALLDYWRRRTAVARELAVFLVGFLQHWLTLKPRGQRSYERTFQELHWIGEDYLASVKKKKLWVEYFLGEPNFTGADLSAKDRQAYLKTWKLVAAFVASYSRKANLEG